MKKLKDGDLVFHKKFGQGIVENPDNYPEVHFKSGHIRCPRRELFIEGDQVLIKYNKKSYGPHAFSKIDPRKFIAYAPQCKSHKYAVSHIISEGVHTIHTYKYVYDIRHIDLPIVQEFDFDEREYVKCQTTCTNYSPMINDDEDYKDMMKSLKCMERSSELIAINIGYDNRLQILKTERLI